MAQQQLTPMMQQYRQIKNDHPDCILFFRLGDFYEMFDEDARTAARELDLTLTSRDRTKAKDDPNRIPMCGIPYHSSEGYIARLVSKGYKVAICEQMEDPATAKGLVKRDITRIVTPGTVTESSMLDERRNNYFACAYGRDGIFGLCFCDVSTGTFYATCLSGPHAVEQTINELARFSPSELLLGGEADDVTLLPEALKSRLHCCVDRGDDALPDVLPQLLDFKIGAVHHGHHHGLNAHHLVILVVLRRHLGFAVGTEQVVAADAGSQPVGQGPGHGGRQGHQLLGLGAGTAEHHALVSGAAYLVIGAQGDVGRLGVNPALDFHGVGVKAALRVHIADFPDHLPGNGRIVHLGRGGNLAADEAEVGGDHGFAGYPGVGVLSQAGIQDGIGDSVCHLVRVAAGNTFRGKKSFFHIYSFLALGFPPKNIKNPHTEDSMCALSNPHLSFAAGFGTLN